MLTAILICLAIVPVALICTYIYRKDKNKEPSSLLVKLFLLGFVSCLLVLILSDILFLFFPFMDKGTTSMNIFEVLAYSFIGVALVEEFCKWLMVYLGAYSHKAYDEVYDGIVYSVYVSLGFAFIENLLYILVNGSVGIGVARGLLAVPAHACDAVFMGYYLSLAKVYASRGQKELEKKNLLLSVIAPTILHGTYDFCLFAQEPALMLIFIIFVITLFIISIKKIKQLSSQKRKNSHENNSPTEYTNQKQNSTEVNPKNNFCPYCGTRIDGNFCGNCGNRQH